MMLSGCKAILLYSCTSVRMFFCKTVLLYSFEQVLTLESPGLRNFSEMGKNWDIFQFLDNQAGPGAVPSTSL